MCQDSTGAFDGTLFKIGTSSESQSKGLKGAPVGQWVKRWPTDLAVADSIPAGENLSNRKQGSTANSLSISTSHYHNKIKIPLKRIRNNESPLNLRASSL